ncbi:Novobiocin biosynthesis protein H [Durusdinium trenchii]|uniref:Novobiocin biosynthesis protein H n=1 Tax=Durusdinium trenchii TaxID=1381693 RepID=A0ABP0HPB8_9DINO
MGKMTLKEVDVRDKRVPHGPIPLHWQRSFAWGFAAAYNLRFFEADFTFSGGFAFEKDRVDARTSRPRDRPEPDPEPEPGEDLHRQAQHLRAAAALWDIFDSDPRQARPTRVGRWDREGGRLNVVLPSGEPVIGHPYFPVFILHLAFKRRFSFLAFAILAMEGKQVAETIPSWDGNPRGWLLAMSWSLEELSGTHGVQNLLSKLEQSPLVRKQLPNTAAVLQQYFNYRRQGHENINAYLVRESLYYEEFLEALMALHGGHQDHAGLLDPGSSSSSSESPSPSSPASKGGSKGSRPDGSRPGSARAGDPPGLSITDSFILTQLRGWRLLSGAALSSEEWRSILASTKNQLDYDSVREALTVLFDEQIMHRSSTSSPPSHGHGTPHFFNMAEEDTWGCEDWWDDGTSWAATAWEESSEWPEEPDGEVSLAEDSTPLDPEAMTADRTWSQAHKSTQMLRKDRGFGVEKEKGKADRSTSPTRSTRTTCSTRAKGNGKMNNFFEEFINYMKGYNYKGKGKGHGKLRSKNQGNVNAYYTEDYDFHGLQFDEEQGHQPDLELGRVEKDTTGLGMLDCGAACSAGPETSIRNLIQAVITQDNQVTQEYMSCSLNRPHFQHSPSTWSWNVHPSSRSLVRVRRVDIVNGLNMFGTGDSCSWAICLRPSPIRSGPDPLTYMAPKKTTPVELDEERRVEADPRDPRSSPTVWPCFNVRVPNMKAQPNKWGTWHHCAVCNLRLDYTPKPGAPANTTACENPTMVQRALKELQAALPQEMNPNGELVKAFMDKVTADKRIHYLMTDARSRLEKNMATVAKAKALVKPSNPATRSKNLRTANSAGYAEEAQPVSPTSSWQAVETTELPTTIEFNPMHYLTAEEKDRVMSMIATRVQQSQAQAQMDFGENVKKLPLYVGQKMMDMACMREGIPVERINLAQGFDLYKPETYTTLLHLFRQQRPKKVWVSTMCTLFCSWVDLNYHDRREVLDKRRRRERKMFRLLTAFLLQVLTEFPDTDLFWEWPLRYRAWNDLIILKFFESLRNLYEWDHTLYAAQDGHSGQPQEDDDEEGDDAVLFTYMHGECKVESADLVIKTLTLRWLMDKPRPKTIIPDNAKSLVSQKLTEFLADLGIEVMPPPDNESWAHGITERAIGHIKETASLLQQSLPDQDPVLTLAMATGANNNTEYVKGYTSIQWAYGKQTSWSLDELRQQLSLPIDRQQQEFLRLLNQRELAEDCARKAKARLVLSKLKNSSIRQPIRTFKMAEPVYIWRKFLPHTIYAGEKGQRHW